MREHVSSLSKIFGARVLVRSGFDFFRDAVTASEFATARRVPRVRLCSADRPDFEIETPDGHQLFEAVEADAEGRERGKEYEKLLPLLDAGELVFEDEDPVETALTGEAASKALRRAAEAKANKGYDPTISLVIRLNPFDFDINHAAIVACMADATEPAAHCFAEVWVLWKRVAYPLWKAGARR
jgi:hypothetical protein